MAAWALSPDTRTAARWQAPRCSRSTCYALHGGTDRVVGGVGLRAPAGEQRQCVAVGSMTQQVKELFSRVML